MPLVSVETRITIDGRMASLYSMSRQFSMTELQQFSYQKTADAASGTYTTIPCDSIDRVQFMFVRADQDLRFRLNAQSDAYVVVKKGGMILLADTDINASATTNIRLNNASGSTAAIAGIVGGA